MTKIDNHRRLVIEPDAASEYGSTRYGDAGFYVERSASVTNGVYFSQATGGKSLTRDDCLQLAADLGKRYGFSVVRSERIFDETSTAPDGVDVGSVESKDPEGDGSHVMAGHRIRTDTDAVESARIAIAVLRGRDASEDAKLDSVDARQVAKLAALLDETTSVNYTERAKRVLALLTEEASPIGRIIVADETTKTEIPSDGTIMRDKDGDVWAVGAGRVSGVGRSRVDFSDVNSYGERSFTSALVYAPLKVIAYEPELAKAGGTYTIPTGS